MASPLPLLLGVCILGLSMRCAATSNADAVNLRRYNQHYSRLMTQRLQRQQAAAATSPYPASGYRPQGPQFVLPNEEPQPGAFQADDTNLGPATSFTPAGTFAVSNSIDQPFSGPAPAPPAATTDDDTDETSTTPSRGLPRRPDFTYGVPPAGRLVSRPPQAARLRSDPRSSRLNANREDSEDDEGGVSVSDIEVGVGGEGEPKPVAAAQPAQFQPATAVYYPASAVGFVQPLSFAPVASPPASAAAVPTTLATAPQITAAYAAQPTAAAFALQPAAASFFVMPEPAPAAAMSSREPAKLLAQQQADISSAGPVTFPSTAAVFAPGQFSTQNFGFLAADAFTPTASQYVVAPAPAYAAPQVAGVVQQQQQYAPARLQAW